MSLEVIKGVVNAYLDEHYNGSVEHREEMMGFIEWVHDEGNTPMIEWFPSDTVGYKYLKEAYYRSLTSVKHIKKHANGMLIAKRNPSEEQLAQNDGMFKRGFLMEKIATYEGKHLMGGFLSKDLLISIMYSIPYNMQLLLNFKYEIRTDAIIKHFATRINGQLEIAQAPIEESGYTFGARLVILNKCLNSFILENYFYAYFIFEGENTLWELISPHAAIDQTNTNEFDPLIDDKFNHIALTLQLIGMTVSEPMEEFANALTGNMAELEEMMTDSGLPIEMNT